ncbi:MAG: hypothetical protein HY677_00885 [Chloroflexi bacterium]|nr:hypothetical protein [Chloroflexota bacterium]
MKKRMWKVGLVGVAVLALVFSAQAVFAAGPFGARQGAAADDQTGYAWCHGDGGGMMGLGLSLQNVAKLLNTDQATLIKDLQSGKTLLEIAQAKGVSQDALVNAILAPEKDMLALRVKYGALTQEEANTILQNDTARVQELIKTKLDNTSFGHGGMMGASGYGGMMGGNGYGGMMGSYGNSAGGSGYGGMMGGSGRGGMMGSWR